MKPDLHNDYKHLICSSNSSVTITDQLFGNDLAKEVKELTEVNRVGKKVATSFGSTQRSHYDLENDKTTALRENKGNYYAHMKLSEESQQDDVDFNYTGGVTI